MLLTSHPMVGFIVVIKGHISHVPVKEPAAKMPTLPAHIAVLALLIPQNKVIVVRLDNLITHAFPFTVTVQPLPFSCST